MNKKPVYRIILGATFALSFAANTILAQEATPPPKPPQTVTEPQRTDVQALTQSIQELNGRLEAFVDELKHFKADLTTVTTLWRSILYEQRQAFLEQRLDEVRTRVQDLEAQEAAIRARLQNLDKEYIATGSAFITQEQARQQLRQQLERQVQQIAARRPGLTQQEQQLRDQLDQVKRKLEETKREMEAIERKQESEGREAAKP